MFSSVYLLCMSMRAPCCAYAHKCRSEFQTSGFPVELLLQWGDSEAGGMFESSM